MKNLVRFIQSFIFSLSIHQSDIKRGDELKPSVLLWLNIDGSPHDINESSVKPMVKDNDPATSKSPQEEIVSQEKPNHTPNQRPWTPEVDNLV